MAQPEPSQQGVLARLEDRSTFGLYVAAGLILVVTLTAVLFNLDEARGDRARAEQGVRASLLVDETVDLVHALVRERDLAIAASVGLPAGDGYRQATAHTDRQWDEVRATVGAGRGSLSIETESAFGDLASLRTDALPAVRAAAERAGSPRGLSDAYSDIVRSVSDSLWVAVTGVGEIEVEPALVGVAILSDHITQTSREQVDVLLDAPAALGSGPDRYSRWDARRADMLPRAALLLPGHAERIVSLTRSPESDAFEELLLSAASADPGQALAVAHRYLDRVATLADDLATEVHREAETRLEEARRDWRMELGAFAATVLLGVVLGWMSWRTHLQRRRIEREIAAAQSEMATLARDLQRQMLAQPLPRIPEIDVAVRYEAAASHANVGGDWYDVFQGPAPELAITIGDVSGHGVEAVVAMQNIRQVVRTLSHQRTDPGEILAQAQGLLEDGASGSGTMATVWLGFLDLETGALRYSSWGHPPPLVCAGKGDAALLPEATNPPLGTPGFSAAAPTESAKVPNGALLLLYTDGLVEGRGMGIDTGIARLLDDVAEHCDEPLEGLADRLLARRPDLGRDDAALLVLRRHDTIRLEVWPEVGGRPGEG